MRNPEANHGKWIDQRQREIEFDDRDPEVLVIGGGQSGLEISARLKLFGVSTLVCEKNKRIGDNWLHSRSRYAPLGRSRRPQELHGGYMKIQQRDHDRSARTRLIILPWETVAGVQKALRRLDSEGRRLG